MKADIHPEYREVLFHDSGADKYFLIPSTLETSETREYEGKTYPYYPLDISSCLLYTSPSPRDGLLSRMPSSA